MAIPPPLVLAFAVKTSGDKTRYSVLALGATVMCQGQVLAKQRWNSHTDGAVFDPQMYRQFWGNKLYLLQAFETSDTQWMAEKALIEGFQQFRRTWESEAMERGVSLLLVCEHVVSDAAWINKLLREHTEDESLPYGASNNTYFYRLWDGDSLCRGWLTHKDPTYKELYGADLRVQQLTNVKLLPSTHFPEDDAAHWAHVVSVVLGLTVSA